MGYLGICAFDGVNLEVTGMVHPDYRRQGIFTKLMTLAFKTFDKRPEKRVLFLCDHASESGQAFIKTLNAQYSFSEYEMFLDFEFDITDERISELNFRKAKNSDQMFIANQNAIYFDKALEDSEMTLPEVEESRGMTIYLASLGDDIIGKVNLQYLNGEAGIYGLGVLPAYRGKGYGRDILRFAVSKSKAFNAKSVMLQVEAENSTALNLYSSSGFKMVSKMDYYEGQSENR